jgi:hypothetical protein
MRNSVVDIAPAGRRLLGAAVAGLLAFGFSPGIARGASTGGGETWRADLSVTGQQANYPSTRARISHDGRYVVYQSVATNLVSNDRNGTTDVYWADLADPSHPVTRRASVGWDGSDANGMSTFTELSGDGRWVVFQSAATNLEKGSTATGSFIRDMSNPDLSTATRLIAAGATRPVISDDGRYVSYNSSPPSVSDVYVKDMQTGRSRRLTFNSPTTSGENLRPEISGDGTHVVFASDEHLLPSDVNASRDIYEADLRAWEGGGTTFSLRLVSVGLNGMAAGGVASRPGINSDGSVVSFQSAAANIVSGDANTKLDSFVRDYRGAAPVSRLVGYDVNGAFPTSGETTRPQLDDSGDIVAFVSTSPNIVAGDTNHMQDAFIRNWAAERTDGPGTHTYLLAVSPAGAPGVCPGIAGGDEGHQAISTRPYLSGNGLSVVFVSGDCNLTVDAAHGGPDTNLMSDIFVRRYPSL